MGYRLILENQILMNTGRKNDTSILMDVFIESASKVISAQDLATIILRMSWVLPPNLDKEIIDRRVDWLSSDDEYFVDLAISMDEIFIANDYISLKDGLADIASRFPMLEDKCNRMLKDWEDIHGRD